MIDGYHRERKLMFNENDSRAMYSSRFTINIEKKRLKWITQFSKFHIASVKNASIDIYGVVILLFNNSVLSLGDFVDRLYPTGLEIKNTTTSLASYLDLHLIVDNEGWLRTNL